MKTSPLLTIGVFVSMFLSSVSLAFQVKNSRPSSKFEKYNLPAKQTELQHKLELADVNMIQEMSPMRQGIGIARVWGMTDQNSHVVARIVVSEKDLPSGYDERKKALEEAADEVAFSVIPQFGKGEISLDEITVEFRSIENMVRNSDKNYAIYSNGELTFH
jgi:hypothetical protein